MEEKGEFEARPEARPAESVTLPRAKASPVTKILCFVFALIAVGLGAFIVYDKVFRPELEKSSHPGGAAIEAKVDNAAEINRKVRKIVEDVRVMMIDLAAGEPFELEKEYDSNVTYEFADGYSTNLEATFGFMFAMESSDKHLKITEREALKSKMSAVLGVYGLKPSKFVDSARIGDDTDYFTSDDGYICEYTAATLPLIFDCGHNSWLSEEKKNLVKSLADAYKVSGIKDGVVYVDADPENIVTTEDGKYQRIMAYLSGAAGLFYRETEGEWKFLKATQQATDCGWFDTDELKAAFAGMTCYEYSEDGVKETIVK